MNKPGTGLTAILYGNPASDNECVVEIFNGETRLSRHELYRATNGAIVQNGLAAYVNDCMKPEAYSRSLCVPLSGSAIFHIAAAMIKRGFICLLRGDAGE